MHCESCAAARFGDRLEDSDNPPEDSEGEKVHPVFESDETPPEGEYCGDCGACIGEPYNMDGANLEDWIKELSMISGQDEECGSATEGAGWAGLFCNITPAELREAGLFGTAAEYPDGLSVILYCDTQGFYDLDTFDSEQSARKHWETVVSELEPSSDSEEN
jgi:hypothetical protein